MCSNKTDLINLVPEIETRLDLG